MATLSVPANVIAPVVVELGVKPVVPALNDVTPPVDAAHVAVVPLDVRTYPFVPIARRVALFVPLPMIKSPVVVIGERALNAADAVVWPVPPLAIGTAERLPRTPELLYKIYPLVPPEIAVVPMVKEEVPAAGAQVGTPPDMVNT